MSDEFLLLVGGVVVHNHHHQHHCPKKRCLSRRTMIWIRCGGGSSSRTIWRRRRRNCRRCPQVLLLPSRPLRNCRLGAAEKGLGRRRGGGPDAPVLGGRGPLVSRHRPHRLGSAEPGRRRSGGKTIPFFVTKNAQDLLEEYDDLY